MSQTLVCLGNNRNFDTMKTAPTYEELLAENIAMKANAEAMKANEMSLRMRIAYLERMLYGRRSDRLSGKVPDNEPGLFDELFKEAMDEKAAKIEAMAKEIEADTRKRRARAKRTPSRPSSYRYAGLEERTTVMMPEVVAAGECDIIGKMFPAYSIVNRPRYGASCIVHESRQGFAQSRIYQAKAPHAVIGGNHVGADMLAQIVIDKYRYHLPEYRQVWQYADLGLKLPTSTLNGWVHAVASRLELVYEALRDDIRNSDYLQIDVVPGA